MNNSSLGFGVTLFASENSLIALATLRKKNIRLHLVARIINISYSKFVDYV